MLETGGGDDGDDVYDYEGPYEIELAAEYRIADKSSTSLAPLWTRLEKLVTTVGRADGDDGDAAAGALGVGGVDGGGGDDDDDDHHHHHSDDDDRRRGRTTGYFRDDDDGGDDDDDQSVGSSGDDDDSGPPSFVGGDDADDGWDDDLYDDGRRRRRTRVSPSSSSPPSSSSQPSSSSPPSSSSSSLSSEYHLSGAIELFRLRPATEYHVRLFARHGRNASAARRSLVWRGAFASCSTGFARLDAAPYVRVNASGAPGFDDSDDSDDSDGDASGGGSSSGSSGVGFEMVSFATDVYFDGDATDGEKYFSGLVAVDAEGCVVWCYHIYLLEAWDFLPGVGGGIVLNALADSRDDSRDSVAPMPAVGGGAVAEGATTLASRPGTDDDGGGGRSSSSDKPAAGTSLHWRANSQLQHISPRGELRSQYVSECAGSPLNYNQISHECRVDDYEHRGGGGDHDGAAAAADAHVLTTRMRGVRLPDTAIDQVKAPTKEGIETRDVFFGSEVVRWDRTSGAVEPLYDLFELANPVDDMFPNDWDYVDVAECSGGETMKRGIDYHHARWDRIESRERCGETWSSRKERLETGKDEHHLLNHDKKPSRAPPRGRHGP